MDGWKDLLAKDEDGTVKVLNSLPKNTLPVAEIGHADPASAADDELYNAAFGGEKTEG